MTTPPVLRRPVPEPMAPQELKELENVAPLLEGTHQLMGPQGERHPVPPALYHLMRDLLEHLKRGESFTVFPHDALLTTQQAAQILNVSRAYLNRLLETEPIPCKIIDHHRWLRLADVLHLRQQRFQQRSAVLDQLSALGQELQGEMW